MPRVLVVDDSLSVRKMVERALETKGLEVIAASSGAEAIERLDSSLPDLIVCDVVMPDVDGYGICESVRSHPVLCHTPVLLISGIVNGAVLDRAARVRSSAVLRKPFTADDLTRKVNELLAARSVAPAEPEVFEPRGTDPEEPLDLKSVLEQLVAMPGVSLAALVDREGFLIEASGELGVGAEVAGALAACLAESSEGIGREMGQGPLSSMILDYEAGMLLLHAAGPLAILAVVLKDPTALGKVRYYVKKSLPELGRLV
jgi:CheY-like chemotaxis protein/predicted regulator of Ras-like GTPase activity (Roadblock/LC7/MglB family)